jgi:2-oxoglutarate dehydrogenase E1 component
MSDQSTPALSGASQRYIAELYQQYHTNPHAVDPSWAQFFDDLGDDALSIMDELTGASWTPKSAPVTEYNGADHVPAAEQAPAGSPAAHPKSNDQDIQQAVLDSVRAIMMIRAYRVRGHLMADLDPLDLDTPSEHPELHPSHYGFTSDDYTRPIYLNGVLGLEYADLREILSVVQDTYCSTIGVEFMHIQDPDQKAWIQERIEAIHNRTDFTAEGRKAILKRLTAAESFEQFLAKKYVATKRFGLEGGEALIPAMEQVMKRGGQLGVDEIVMGMAHRGRLNVLANVMGKSYEAILSEFQGTPAIPEDVEGAGDVKYHLGASTDRGFDGNEIHLSLAANPSHLESVNPVVMGKVRAKQRQKGDTDRTRTMGLLIHGDAAVAGQGLVAETLHLSELESYRTGGTIHFVINNQIGFTTRPKKARSSPYCTDAAKIIQAPIFHVNGDDPEAVVHVARIATEFRQQFNKDIFIDLICYRRHGHNEGDEPSFTQPMMYDAIDRHDTTRDIYARKLTADGLITQDEADDIRATIEYRLAEAFEAAKEYEPDDIDMLEGRWSNLSQAPSNDNPRRGSTAIDHDTAIELGQKMTELPDDFTPHRKIKRFMNKRRQMFDTGEDFDWATAEALAFTSLVNEGIPVRLAGQDTGRGTFSQRHAIVYDHDSGRDYQPLQHLSDHQAHFQAIDSPLSEAGAMGFEYGYSLAEPHALVCWEAQFGDFVNGAQVIIDQYLTAGEDKWFRMSGLTLLLPHGYEGQGPEHSSARLERFLTACADDNIQVANCTTPANYFHILRRQVLRNFRKPLVLMTPKSLLRHKLCVSNLDQMTGDHTFHRVLDERLMNTDLISDDQIKRLIICSGKVYYDLFEARAEKGINDIAILRLEQFYPFPSDAIIEQLNRYHPDIEVIWCQEEPENMGGWNFVDRRLEGAMYQAGLNHVRPSYIGRPGSASPATGIHAKHVKQQNKLIEQALDLTYKQDNLAA